MAHDGGPSVDQKLEFIEETRGNLKHVREQMCQGIIHIDKQLAKLDLAQEQLTGGEKNVSVPYLTPMEDPVDASMARHPAGKKRKFRPVH